MCNTNHDPNKGKEKLNEESKNSKCLKIDTGAEGQELSPFVLFGFIIDPTKGIRKAYSCNFCSQKFVSPQALGGHQNCHKLERRLKKKNETMNKACEIFSNVGCGYQNCGIDIEILHAAGSSSFDAWNLHHFQHMDQNTVNQQVTMTEIDFGMVSEGGANSDAHHEHKETHEEEEASKNIDLNLKL